MDHERIGRGWGAEKENDKLISNAGPITVVIVGTWPEAVF